MVSQYAPIGRSFEVARNPYYFGQYNKFQPSYTETVYPSVEQRERINEFPYVADIKTGGQEQSVSKWNYLENLRFTT